MPSSERCVETPAKLSFAQQRLWFLDRLRPGRADHNVPVAVRLRGPLDQGALVLALTEVVRRHEVLRSRIVVIDDTPYQVTEPVDTFVPALNDLAALPWAQAEERAHALAVEDAGTPFDLGTAPLLRARLIRTAADDHLLVLVFHHIAADGWSLSVLWQEFSAVYRAAVCGRPSDLPELPVQYADFADWQHQHLTGTALREQLAHWRERLGHKNPSSFPTDHPRPALWSGRGDQIEVEFPAELTPRIRALGLAHEVTPFITLLAAFQVLLAHHSGEPDLPVGTPISGRTRIEVEPLIGFFVNTLVLRTDLTGDPTFTEALDRARRCAMDAYSHQDVPFERLVEELHPERDLGRHPLFTVMFQVEAEPALPSGLPELEASAHHMPYDLVKFDVEVSLTDRGDRFTGVVRYAADLFERSTVERFAEDYRELLDRLVTSPEQPISAWGPQLAPRAIPAAPVVPPEAGRGTPDDAPPTETELLVLEVWSEVLDVAPSSVHDDFFVLGGHSLLASKVMSRLCRALDFELPLTLLFYCPTVAELAQGIEAALLADLENA
ncbi:condensation domain-containing protein [Streptomyces sp. NBC_00237]|uniref:condensation domain-containing protein n=1 Tax=Streptomyces sp. NBC_00237 TaxID=2975687 RepID=UPI002258C16C|nr:condensation domain-containing protein [Streptomyces sp. NBC_00237]MCX5202719.1 condensation domain-containing protein [Streptomyces sp. NBC_00237]